MQAIMPEFMRTNDLPHILIQRLVENDIVLTAIGQIIALQVAKIMVLDFDTKLFGQGIGPARMIPVPQYLNLFQDKMHSDHPNPHNDTSMLIETGLINEHLFHLTDHLFRTSDDCLTGKLENPR